jgi:hypothetical protein
MAPNRKKKKAVTNKQHVRSQRGHRELKVSWTTGCWIKGLHFLRKHPPGVIERAASINGSTPLPYASQHIISAVSLPLALSANSRGHKRAA